MLDFVEGRYDVLVATAIVESGLDIPRANTIVIDRADLFGLSQLYQLRGRVGRSKERAYCYLAVPNPSEMTDEARSRVEALEGTGRLGLQDREPRSRARGAGDILGGEQSGNVAGLGCPATCSRRPCPSSGATSSCTRSTLSCPSTSDAPPEEYVSDVVRLPLYVSGASTSRGRDVGRELEERFGPPTRQLLRAASSRSSCGASALGCDATGTKVTPTSATTRRSTWRS